jgi:hypothetical protein
MGSAALKIRKVLFLSLLDLAFAGFAAIGCAWTAPVNTTNTLDKFMCL